MVALFVGDHLLLRDFGPYGVIFMNVCAVVVLFKDFGTKAIKCLDCICYCFTCYCNFNREFDCSKIIKLFTNYIAHL
jgi:hypothetical protein